MASPRISFEDYVDINNLMVKYQFMVDSGDQVGWSGLFTEDGRFMGMGEDFVGRHELKKIAAAGGQMGGQLRHMPGALWIEYGDTTDEVFVRFYNLITTWLPGDAPAPALSQMAVCKVHFVRQGGDWKIKSNDAKMLSPTPKATLEWIQNLEPVAG